MMERVVVVAAATLLAGATLAAGQGATRGDEQPVLLTGGFAEHLAPVAGGRIDWTNGRILAEGIGYAKPDQQAPEQMAERAATIQAARNALAIANGIRLDATGRVADVRQGRVRIEGVVKGHEIVERHWDPDADPPACRVVLSVPLWGVKSMASVFARTQRVRVRRTITRRYVLTRETADVRDTVIVLDARGVEIEPCLFPVVVDDSGQALYDVSTLDPRFAERAPTARYVRTTMTFERLRALLERAGEGNCFVLAQYGGARRAAERVARPKPRATQPASQPGRTRPPRRAKRRIAVKVQRAAGRGNTQLVLTKEDAERLRQSAEASTAFRKAQVLIVVDAPAAGTEGRLPVGADGVFVLGPR
jgi:hypothetical protein